MVIDLHRFYHPTATSKVEIRPTAGVAIAFDATTLELHLATSPGLHGVVDVPFTIVDGKQRKEGVVTLALRAPSSHTFTFHPEGKITTVALAGSFNGWNKTATVMNGNSSGTYTVTVPLDPGTYSYKFVVDDKWVTDPTNPTTSSDGMGGTNSVLKVEAPDSSATTYIYPDAIRQDTASIRSSGSGKIARSFAVAEQPDGSMKPLPSTTQENGCEVALKQLAPGTWVRVIATDEEGHPSNVVRFPVRSTDSFRWQDAILYYALTDRFSDGDKQNDHPVDDPNVQWSANFHGGDWRGIEERIRDGYFEHLGVNTIWIAPLNRNPANAYREYPEPHRWYTGYHGYWPVSATELEPHFGDGAALKSLVHTAHAHGFHIIADLVLHHVHEQHPWWKQHRDWFGTLELPDGTKNLRRWDDYQFTTWFEPYLPTFNFANPAPVKALIDNSAWWAREFDLDGFRLDAVKHIPQSFWWQFRSALREQVESKRKRPLYLVGETFKDRAGIDSFVGPNMLDGQFDFPLYDSIKDAFGEGKEGLDNVEASLAASEASYGKEALMSPLIGNHDKGRFMAYADGELPGPKGVKEEEIGWTNPPKVKDVANYSKLELAQALLLSIDGVPMIYYGDEVGMSGAGDPDNRRDMRFGKEVTEPEQLVVSNFEKLTAIRRKHTSLRYGSRRPVIAEKDFLAFVRAFFDDRVACVFNRATAPVQRELLVGPELRDGEYVDELTGSKTKVVDGKLHVDIPPRTAAFYVRAP